MPCVVQDIITNIVNPEASEETVPPMTVVNDFVVFAQICNNSKIGHPADELRNCLTDTWLTRTLYSFIANKPNAWVNTIVSNMCDIIFANYPNNVS